MASKNLKPKNSSDSEGEAEWTFIDTDEGTIETRKDSVTYRKPTYSEILKGVVAEDLAEEVDSEPEFEVLASFKFRPKGESFGLGSSAPKTPKDAKNEGDRHEEGDGDDSCSSDDGIMIISSYLTGEDKVDNTSNFEAPSHNPNDDDYDTIDKKNNDGSLDDEIKDKETNTDKTIHDVDDDDDFVITDENESDFEDTNMNDAADTDDDDEDEDEDEDEDDDDGDDDDDEVNEDVESVEEELTESTANSLNASTIKDPESLERELQDEDNDSDSNNNSEDGFLGIHTGGICDNPEKDLDWDSLTFQLLSTLPRMIDSTTTIGDDSPNPTSQDGMIHDDSIQDSDSESTSNSHSSYTAISQDDKQDEISSFDELSDSADVNMDLDYDPMIPRWLFNADKNIYDDIESFDDDSDYIISETEELEYEESRLIPQWLFDPNHEVKDVEESIDGDFEFINSDLDDLENNPVVPRWLYNPCYQPKDINESLDDDFEEPHPLIPRWFFDPNFKMQDLEETFVSDNSDYSDYESESDDDSALTLPRWFFDKNFKPPSEKDEEGLSWTSQLFVDIPTFIILLCLTTALGFSIGHGLTLYFSNQSIDQNAKLQTMETPTKQFTSSLEDLGLTPEEIAKLDLLKLEDELYQQKESDMLSEHLRFDLRELYKSLKEKHYRLLRNQKSTEDRLHITKTMSRYWRLKYDEEKRRNKVTSLSRHLRPKNFSDMANLAKKTKLVKKWKRQFKKNGTTPWLEKKNSSKSNLKWLVRPLGSTLKGPKRLGTRYWMKAVALSKNNDMKNFRNRWTKDLKELKRKSCCSRSNMSIQFKKTAVSSLFGWVNDSKDCKRVKRSDILGLCSTKASKKNIPIIEKQAKTDSGRKSNDLKHKPCFSKPKNTSNLKQTLENKLTISSKKITQKQRKNSPRSSDRHEKVRKERIKKRELKKKALEIKNQVHELKSVLTELRRERRRAEREKAKLEASWRKLKRQRLQFEKERKEQSKNHKKTVTKVKSKLTREKIRLNTWKSVAKRAQKKAQTLHKNLKRVTVAKQKLEDIKHIKKDLKIEKRKLRQQQKNLKSLKQQLRKEHRNYARERWKTKKKRRELEKQKFNESKPTEKSHKAKKEKKTRTKPHKKAQKQQREQPYTKRTQDKKKKQKAQKKFWDNIEKSLYKWAQKVNRTIEHHRRGKVGKIWKKLRTQFDNLVAWTTGKRAKSTGPLKKERNKRQSKAKVNPVFEKILAEQMKYDKEKKTRQKDSESQWQPKGPVVNEKTNRDAKKKKKARKKNDPDVLLRQRQRKQRRKYKRELERLQQWALQMNEKKLEHERIYREKDGKLKRRQKRPSTPKPSHEEEEVAEKRERFSNSQALVSVEDSNSTFMLLLQPQLSKSANSRTPETNRKRKPKYRDKKSIVEGVTRSQINHELNKKKTQTSLTIPFDDDVLKPPDDVNKGKEARESMDVTSRGDESRSDEPTPPSLSPTFYKDFPILRIIDEAKRKRDGSLDVADVIASDSPKGPEDSQNGDIRQRTEPWYMRRAEQRDEFRNVNPSLTLFPRPIGPFKSDGTWFFHRSSDRALQRELYEPLNRQTARDGLKHKHWRSYFHRGRRRRAETDGKWMFERASDRAEQRVNSEPWYMRRAEGREEDREENKDSWFVERGFDRDLQHDYDEDDEDDDLMNDYYHDDDDYDDFADHGYDEYENPW